MSIKVETYTRISVSKFFIIIAWLGCLIRNIGLCTEEG